MAKVNKAEARDVALEALANGKTPAKAATAAGVELATVRGWLTRDAAFRAELNAKRQDAYNAGADRLRALVPAALDALESELNRPDRLQAAIAILKMAGLSRLEAPKGPTNPEGIVSEDQERETWAALARSLP